MNRMIFVVVLALASQTMARDHSTPSFVLPSCLQDQYGNQYFQLSMLTNYGIVTGQVKPGQNQCQANYTMVGSWTLNSAGQVILEISVANNSGNSCASIYKLKGPYPFADWFYSSNQNTAQNFRYAACSADSPTVPDTGSGGTYGPKSSDDNQH